MGWLFTLVAVISPRLGLAALWYTDNRVQLAFDSWVFPTVGLILLPWTTLTYTLAYAPVGGVTGFGWGAVFCAFLLDTLVWATSSVARRGDRVTTTTYSHTTAYGPDGAHW